MLRFCFGMARFPEATGEYNSPLTPSRQTEGGARRTRGRLDLSGMSRLPTSTLPILEPFPTPTRVSRRKNRLRRFILCETLAILLLFFLTEFTSAPEGDETTGMLTQGAFILVAAAVALIPIFFYGRPRSDYRSGR